MKAEAEHVSEPHVVATPCGKCSCIIMYKGDLCIFCDAAIEMIQDTLSNYGVSSNAIKAVDVESERDCDCNTDDVLVLPTIKICDVKLTGLPDEQIINDAVIRAVMKECFCE